MEPLSPFPVKEEFSIMAMDFTFGDLYPSMMNYETGHKANPDAEDQAALNENAEQVKESASRGSRPRYVLMAVAMVALLVVFFGVE